MGDHDEMRGFTVAQTLKGVHCSYDVYFKLMVMKHEGETKH
jgi:hypothetical protein